MILFLSHELTLTGAPIALREFLRWRKLRDTHFEVLAGRGGPLEASLAEICPVTVLFRGLPQGQSLIHRALQRQHISRLLKRWKSVELIYANTVATGNLLSVLAPLNRPAICHVHELETVIQQAISGAKWDWNRFDHLIAGSVASKTNLEVNHGITTDKISVCRNFIQWENIQKQPDESECQEARRELGIPDHSQLVGMVGTLEPRKGPDLWIEMAAQVLRLRKNGENPVHFVWIGGQIEGSYFESLRARIDELGITQNIHFVGQKTNPLQLMQAFNVFTLTSREEPFGIVILEAASQGIPIICFDESGGAPEFVEQDCGFVVPHLNTQIMADQVLELLRDEAQRNLKGKTARLKCRERHNIDIVAPQIEDVIQRCLQNKQPHP